MILVEFKIIMDKIQNGIYDRPKKLNLYGDDHVIDENKSVKWNREEVVRRNEKIKAEKNVALTDQFKEDVIEYILKNYEINNNKEIAISVYKMAWETGHSYGLHDVLQEVIEFAEFAETILIASKD